MKLKLTAIFSAIVLFVLLQSCTVPNPYEPINNGTTTTTTASTNNGGTTNGNVENDKDDDDDDNGTTTGGTGTGTTTGGTTTGGTGTGTTTGGTTTGGTGTGTTTGGTTTGGTTTTGIVLGGNSSTTGLNKSHNMGMNCMSCHNPGGSGSGKGVWQVGGTAYNQAGTTTTPNVVVKFYTGPNGTGTLKYTLNADSKGNFYSVGPVDFTGGLYPAVVGATSTKYMGSSITNGACNSCHTGGTGTARIWTN